MPAQRKRASKKTRKAGDQAPRSAATPPAESPLLGVARQVRSWSDSVLGIAGAAPRRVARRSPCHAGQARATRGAREDRHRAARNARSRRHERQGGWRGDQPQGSRAAGTGRERQGCPALRNHPAARVGARAQRSDLVRDAVHALLQSRPLAYAGESRASAASPCRRAASASSPTSIAAAMPRARYPTTTSPRCWRSPGRRSTWRSRFAAAGRRK